MITNQSSFHSVSKVVVDGKRCCLSNYYFSETPAEKQQYFHVTLFYGRPEEPYKNILLRLDSFARNLLRKFVKRGLVKKTHIYRKDKPL